jgi:GTPase
VGTVECDSIHVGDEVAVALSDGTYIQSTVSVMEINRKEIEVVEKDTLVGIVLDGVDADSGVDYNNVIYLLKK